MSLSVDPSRLSGVKRESTYLAVRSIQGGREVFSVRLPLTDVTALFPLPDAENPDEDNRRVNLRHAKEFGMYLANPRWVAPALLVRDAGGCTFEPLKGSNGEIGYLTIPWTDSGLSLMLTIDGQHRILGIDLEIKRVAHEIQGIDRALAKGGLKPDRVEKLNAEKERFVAELERMRSESIGVDIYREKDGALARQMFVDVADNARGISAAVRSRFDSSKVANRTLDHVIRHALLKGRVDMEQDRMTKGSPHLIGAKHVADITRGVMFGTGRTSKAKEAALEDNEVVAAVLDFLDCITEAFPDLAAVADGTLSPQVLRENSLLGSVGMLRVLAAVFHNLRAAGVEAEAITGHFRSLAPSMGAPVQEVSIWRKDPKTSESFEVGAYAPVMRQQNISYIVEAVTGWYKKR
ncbi:DNA sulfur modification protein DndB [Streptomyces sp. NPDC097981]|uniref:DNA sulfur modification protein DndB n=1 Tax=Streptomyces sp. NPDC097981 TaxID=3155428 RepID=UPI00332310EC